MAAPDPKPRWFHPNAGELARRAAGRRSDPVLLGEMDSQGMGGPNRRGGGGRVFDRDAPLIRSRPDFSLAVSIQYSFAAGADGGSGDSM